MRKTQEDVGESRVSPSCQKPSWSLLSPEQRSGTHCCCVFLFHVLLAVFLLSAFPGVYLGPMCSLSVSVLNS